MDTNSQVLLELSIQRDLLQQLVWLGWVIAIAAVARVVIAALSTWNQRRREGFAFIAAPAYMERRFDQLTQMCHERLATQPSDPYPHFYLGLVLFEQGQLQESVPHFERALNLSPAWGPQIQPYLQRARDGNAP